MRHKDVRICPVGALAFMLGFRFAQTREFESFTAEQWLDNSSWFDVKLLVDASRSTNRCDPMKNNSYSDAIKSVLMSLSIPSTHFVHLGRVVGPKILETKEVDSEEIRRLGNWDPKIQESCYSTKLPMTAMRAMAGYTTASGMYYNPRTVVHPPEELLLETPFAFSISACGVLERAVAESDSFYTALCFLRLMKRLGEVLLQDAATIWIKYPERRPHFLFTLRVFGLSEFEVSCCCCCCCFR